MAQEACQHCRFFAPHKFTQPHTGAQRGVCRRYPPALLYDPEYGEANALQPTVDAADDWCGEFSQALVRSSG